MDTSLKHDIIRMFDLAGLRHEASRLTGDAWREYQQIQSRYEKERDRAEQIYATEYDDRVQTALKELIDRAGRKTWLLQPRFGGHDDFHAVRLEFKARAQVENDHFVDLSLFDNAERDELNTLLDRYGRGRETDRPVASQMEIQDPSANEMPRAWTRSRQLRKCKTQENYPHFH
jgi:hypothetical protein